MKIDKQIPGFKPLTSPQVDPKKLININAFSLDRVLEMDPQFMDTEGSSFRGSVVDLEFLEFEDS